jgi:hypothetical protein
MECLSVRIEARRLEARQLIADAKEGERYVANLENLAYIYE